MDQCRQQTCSRCDSEPTAWVTHIHWWGDTARAVGTSRAMLSHGLYGHVDEYGAQQVVLGMLRPTVSTPQT
eukprot:391042-Amphidinium_carterae.1